MTLSHSGADTLGPSSSAVVGRVAELDRPGPLDEPGDELVVQAGMHVGPLVAGADLAAVPEPGLERLADGQVQVGVGEHEQRGLAAQLQGHGHDLLGAWARTSRPARVDPVRVTIEVRGCSTSRRPTVRPSPQTTLTSPSGRPASWQTRATANADSGVSSLGLTTTALPAMRAGPTLRAKMAAGKFQGMMAATTP